MRTKPDVEFAPDLGSASKAIQALLSGLTTDELEHLAKALIRAYQCRAQKAHDLYEEIGQLEAAAAQHELRCRRHDYHIAMLNLHAQHELVSLIVDRLGYVPEVDGQRSAEN